MTVLVVIGGAVVVVALLSGLARRNPGLPGRVPALVSWVAEPDAAPRPSQLVAWESLLLSAATGGRRGRARLSRHLEPLVASLLLERHRVAITDRAATEVLGWEWAYIRGEVDAPAGEGDESAAVHDAVESLLDRLATPRPGPAA